MIWAAKSAKLMFGPYLFEAVLDYPIGRLSSCLGHQQIGSTKKWKILFEKNWYFTKGIKIVIMGIIINLLTSLHFPKHTFLIFWSLFYLSPPKTGGRPTNVDRNTTRKSDSVVCCIKFTFYYWYILLTYMYFLSYTHKNNVLRVICFLFQITEIRGRMNLTERN
jgi:hypothetical protein